MMHARRKAPDAGSRRTQCDRWGVVYHFEPGEQPEPPPTPPVNPPAPNPWTSEFHKDFR